MTDEPWAEYWRMPSANLRLGQEAVHVWLIDLESPQRTGTELTSVLSAEERARAERFRLPAHRHAYRVAHGALRDILARQLDLRPEALRFCCNEHGKPEIEPEQNPGQFQFNLAHTRAWAVLAVCRRHPVGADVERLRPNFATQEIAQRFFAPEEVAALSALSGTAQSLAFFHCWTRKEAYLKALGEGLSRGLASFAVSLTPGVPAALLWDRRSPDAPEHWHLWSLPAPPNHVAAVAASARLKELRAWRWTG